MMASIEQWDRRTEAKDISERGISRISGSSTGREIRRPGETGCDELWVSHSEPEVTVTTGHARKCPMIR